MVYAAYSYYKETYKGTMSEADFTCFSRRASAYLGTYTRWRITGAWRTDERVLDACCAVADVLYSQAQGGEVTSVTNDGYTESYAACRQTAAQKQYAALTLYLAATGLLYQGVL